MLSVFGTFFGVLLVVMYAVGVGSGGALKGPDAFWLRWTVISLAVAFSALMAWLRWRYLVWRAKRSASVWGRTKQPVATVPPVAPSSLPMSAMPMSAIASKALAAAGRQAIVFRQHVPPRHDPSALSFFGGAPIAPIGFVWPRSATSKPFSFIMQIDCAAVPAQARLGLPDNGVLYFFLDLGWGEDGGFCVRHEAGPADQWAEVAVPVDLGTAFGKEAVYLWKWTRAVEDCPVLLPKWTFDPVVIDVPEQPVDREVPEAPILWPGDKPMEQALRDAQDEDVPLASLSVDDFDGPSGTLLRPVASFPHDWRAVQICSGLIRAEAQRKSSWRRAADNVRLSADQQEAFVAAIKQEADNWFDRAAAMPPHAAVPPEDREAFWSWLSQHARLTRFILGEAMTLSAEASLTASAEAAARVPAEAIRSVRARHVLALRTERGLFVTTPDRMLGPPADVQGNQYERAQTHLLLLEMSSNEGLGHHFGEGVYQFWIVPEDLKARRFDKVELTTDAY